MRRTAGILAITAAALLFANQSALAEKCTGSWGGSAPTSITFKAGHKLRYCYRDQCWNSEWLGDKASKLVFRIGNGGATVEMTARKGGYKAIWRNGNNSSRANLSCK